MDNGKYHKKKLKATEIESRAKSEKLRYRIILGLILIFTYSLFAKAINYQFVNWDDNSYILRNFLIRDFSFEGFKKIFSTPVIGMYNPITFVIYALEYHFGGLDPQVFHLINILFHLVAVVVTFNFIYQLTKRYEAATIVALFFAIHPMHTSVIAWVSELKTSLYLIFYLLALTSYIKYIRSNYQVKHLVYTALLFLVSVLGKPSAVTLAPMLLLIDYYFSRNFDRRLILEKIPFFAMAMFFGILTVLTHIEAEDSIFESNNSYSLINNILVSNYSIVFYLNKLFVPTDLCTIYPYPHNAPIMNYKYYVSMLIIPFVLWLVYKSGNFRKEMIFGLLFFVISISVVLRIVPSGFFRYSNVYTYDSYIGLFFIVAMFFTYVIDNKFAFASRIKRIVMLFLGMLVVLYSVIASARIKVWENSMTLFSDIIKQKPKFAIAYSNRGISELETGNVNGALQDFAKAIELDSNYAVAYNNMAKILIDQKDYDNALKDLNKALTLNPKYGEAYINRGNIKFYKEKYDEALSDYDCAIRFEPALEISYRNRSKIEIIKNVPSSALKDLDKALSLNPEYYDAYIDRGVIMYRQGKLDEAMKDFNSAIKINPNGMEAYGNRAAVKFVQKDTLGAKEDADIANALRNGTNAQTH